MKTEYKQSKVLSMNSGDYIVYMPPDPLAKDYYLTIGESYLLLSSYNGSNGVITFNVDIPMPGVGTLGYFIDGTHFISQEEYRIYKINEIIKG